MESRKAPAMSEPTETWRIHPLHVPGCVEPVEITADGITFGREASNDVVLPVSRASPGA